MGNASSTARICHSSGWPAAGQCAASLAKRPLSGRGLAGCRTGRVGNHQSQRLRHACSRIDPLWRTAYQDRIVGCPPMKQTERNFWLDINLFITFLSTVFTGFTLWLLIPHQSDAVLLGFNRPFWLTAHIFSGLAGLTGTVIHIIWHREWLKALRRRPIFSLPSKLRANRVADRLVWIFFLATILFCVLDWIIPAFENRVSIFGRLHVVFGIAWLIGIIVHLVLHRKLISSITRLYIGNRKESLITQQKV